MAFKSQPLQNTCRWSSSRASTFNECKKKYWYSYYGSWEGWPKTPFDKRSSINPLAQWLYRLKNIQGIHLFLGSSVHSAIEWFLQETLKRKTALLPQEFEEKALYLFDKGLQDSKEKAWQAHPKKHVNLLEHYYNIPIREEDISSFREKVSTCIRNFYDSPCIQNVVLSPKAKWMGIESLQTFSLAEGIEAICVYDLFLLWPCQDGREIMMIFDWKTGKESPKILDQLLAYAISANKLFQKPLDLILLTPFFMMQGPLGYKKYGALQKEPLDPLQIQALEEKMLSSTKEMLQLHGNEQATPYTPPDPLLFSYTGDRRACQSCPFQEVCKKAQFQEKNIEELHKLVETA